MVSSCLLLPSPPPSPRPPPAELPGGQSCVSRLMREAGSDVWELVLLSQLLPVPHLLKDTGSPFLVQEATPPRPSEGGD